MNILTKCIKRSWLGELSQEARIIHNIEGKVEDTKNIKIL